MIRDVICYPRLCGTALLVLAVILGIGSGCDDDPPPYCGSGDCVCSHGASCAFGCDAPPCSVNCVGNNRFCGGDCANGSCECGRGSYCDFACAAPPCHVDCAEHSNCVGTCANGTCTCSVGASCRFDCDAGPCHVECSGQNHDCRGVCANGTCHCGAESSCAFECSDSNCKIECSPSASCVLECPKGDAGSTCVFSECSAQTICPDGRFVTCNAPCPIGADER